MTLVRLAFVAAALGGIGLLAYAALWIVVPFEDAGAGRPLVVAPPDHARTIRVVLLVGALVGLASLVGAPLGLGLGFGFGHGPGLLGPALIVVGVLYLVSRQQGADPPATGAAQVLDAEIPTTVLPPTEAAGAPARRSASRPGLLLARVVAWAAILGGLLVAVPFAVLVAIGALALRLPALAAVVAFGALALLVATATGARRAWPILVSLVVFLAAGALAVGLVDWTDGVGRRLTQPLSADAVRPTYHLAAGQRVLDLTFVDVPEQGLDIAVQQGIGVVEVVLPQDTAVVATATVRAGEADVLGRVQNGTDVRVTSQEGSGARQVRLTVDLGVGQVQVCRASAAMFVQWGCPD